MSLNAGVASVNIQDIVLRHRVRNDERILSTGSQWPQKVRCLVLDGNQEPLVIFNADWGRWYRLHDEVRSIVWNSIQGNAKVLCFGTWANYNIDDEGFRWAALDPKSKRFDKELRDGLLNAFTMAFERAWDSALPVQLSLGFGECTSVCMNSYLGNESIDPKVNVLRIADLDNRPIAVLVDYASRGDDRLHGVVSGGLAGAVESTVQRLYHDVPLFYFNRCGSDHFPAMADPPREELELSGKSFQVALAPFETQEYDRLGRVLGGEIVKVLSEIEVSGRQLFAINERWRYTNWERDAPGRLLSAPIICTKSIPIALEYGKSPSVGECARKIKELDQQIRAMKRELAKEGITAYPVPLRPDDQDSTLVRLMKVGSQRAYWGPVCRRAKREHRSGRPTPPKEGTVDLLAFDSDVAVVCFPGTLCASVVENIRRMSPFARTLVWGALAPFTFTHVIPEDVGRLGGFHKGAGDFTQSSIDTMVGTIVGGLNELQGSIRRYLLLIDKAQS